MGMSPERTGTAKAAVLAGGFVVAGLLWAVLALAAAPEDGGALTPGGRNLAAVFIIVITLWVRFAFARQRKPQPSQRRQ